MVQMYSIPISSGLFTSDCKISKWKSHYAKKSPAPILKTLDPFLSFYFISLISKVIERIVCNQVEHFLLKSNILHNYQSRFWEKRLINLCLSFLIDKILKGFNKGLFTSMILFDFQKALYTTNYEILPGKFHGIDFSEKAIAWFKSYLTAFKVNINNHFSD